MTNRPVAADTHEAVPAPAYRPTMVDGMSAGELAVQVSPDNPDPFVRLWRDHGGWVAAAQVCQLKLSGRSQDEIDDAVSACAAIAFQSACKIDGADVLKNWPGLVAVIAHNAIDDQFRRENAQKRDSSSRGDREVGEAIHGRQPRIEDAMLPDDRSLTEIADAGHGGRLGQAVSRIQDDFARAIIDLQDRGHTVREIGVILNVDRGKVHRRILKTREELRALDDRGLDLPDDTTPQEGGTP